MEQAIRAHGTLEVICGPMFSGKSEELIRRIRRAKIARQSVMVFKPSIDNRYAIEQVMSHNGSSVDALPVDNPETIYHYVTNEQIAIVGIDEVQFFDSSIIAIICKLVDEGKRVIAGGLDLDFRSVPFGPMPTLLAIADKITKLQAICSLCGHDAPLTQRLVNGQPARYADPIILVGAQDSYQARCRGCYAIDLKHAL